MSLIRPITVIDPKAGLNSNVKVGVYTIIGPNIRISMNTEIGPYAVVSGHITMGEDSRIFQFISLGGIPQDEKYSGEPIKLTIGDGNIIRELIALDLGTVTGMDEARIDDDNWTMAYCHPAHDCAIGNHTVFADNVLLARHITVGDYVVLDGCALVFQFCRIGDCATTAFAASVYKDAPPYFMAADYRTEPAGLNSEGMRRSGPSTEQIVIVKDIYKVIYYRGIPLEEVRTGVLQRTEARPELAASKDFFVTSMYGVTR